MTGGRSPGGPFQQKDSPAAMTAAEQDRQRRLEWFRAARFGMFVHWGLYSLIGRHEWAMNRERIPVEEYERLADAFRPLPRPATMWAQLAVETGMRYIVMTAKHHEGYCLWDSELTDYNSVRRGPGRDLVAEFVEAAREAGLRVGLYYSLNDWHHPDGRECLYDEEARNRFVEYTHALVRELCSNYGKIDILWYDCPYPLTAQGWESERMNAMVRSLQPDILINNRSRIPEDFETPEQHITPAKGGRAWESCMTLNDSWGYTPIDRNYKTAWQVVRMLRQVASHGGNLLLNIGPAPDGSIPPVYREVFGQVGRWLEKNGPAIYDASEPMVQDWQATGDFTRRGNTAYFHCNRWPGSTLVIGGFETKVLSVRYPGGPAVEFEQTPGRLILKGLPMEAPDHLATVFEIECDGEPRQRLSPLMQAPDEDLESWYKH